MPNFSRLAVVFGLALFPLTAHAQARNELPCQAYSRSSAVFVGVAAAPVKRWVQLPNHPPLEMKLTPVMVERAFLGVSTPVMYLTGIEPSATPGQKYLVYGSSYRPPDIVFAGPGSGAKEIDAAAEDLAFLEALAPVTTGGTIAGVVRLKKEVVRSAPQGGRPGHAARTDRRSHIQGEAFDRDSYRR